MNTLPSFRALELSRRLDRLRHCIDPSINRPEVTAVTTAKLDAIEQHLTAIEDAHKPKPGKRLDGAQLWESLAIAVHRFTTAKRSARLNAADLWDLVKQYCPAYDVDCEGGWAERGTSAVVGLLRSEPQVRKLIEARGIKFWENWQDEQFRFVDPRWLESHADIYAWLTQRWAGGRKCRFCAMVENDLVPELQPIEAERRNGITMIGNSVVLDSASAALTHEHCRPHFIAWQVIAKKYASKEEAVAADNAAGRESRYQKVKEAGRLEAPTDG